MIVFKDKGYEARSDKPNEDWTNQALYILPDNSEIAKKIKQYYPNYDFVVNGKGELIDVVEILVENPPEPPSIEDRMVAVEETLLMIL